MPYGKSSIFRCNNKCISCRELRHYLFDSPAIIFLWGNITEVVWIIFPFLNPSLLSEYGLQHFLSLIFMLLSFFPSPWPHTSLSSFFLHLFVLLTSWLNPGQFCKSGKHTFVRLPYQFTTSFTLRGQNSVTYLFPWKLNPHIHLMALTVHSIPFFSLFCIYKTIFILHLRSWLYPKSSGIGWSIQFQSIPFENVVIFSGAVE